MRPIEFSSKAALLGALSNALGFGADGASRQPLGTRKAQRNPNAASDDTAPFSPAKLRRNGRRAHPLTSAIVTTN